MAVLEAAASGLPVVSTRHTGIVDAVIDGKTGFLVDEGDIDGMAEYIYLLLSKPELAAEMGKRAREHMCQNFSMESSVQNLQYFSKNTLPLIIADSFTFQVFRCHSQAVAISARSF